ncbi:hypothetical protein Ctaglu_41080 [Clostridium tagluense]|uniref:Uncharacterized protein n=1 Tax=Clostridium tagluense TaxID=360422 RepID=A0A401USF7_9CLOT|nr:hypothetical protein Ctaglu_41080 [Clostridium tagluense]
MANKTYSVFIYYIFVQTDSGGCSPIGMKKQYRTFIHESALEIETIIVSAGKIGFQIEINPNSLKDIVGGQFEDLIK